MKYQIYTKNGTMITQFESDWVFKEHEQIFMQFEYEKRNFHIIRITHDLYSSTEHIVRLYCQEKKVYE
ncbi:hypothetical protein P6P90_13600 [Ectobacillus antri]|jgi:hypothetical protein|uniref:DUF2187 domain-containing protein n=1 Tax=Ectobacillus antri TaxID=2486280 RepID=A0ABT6H6W8_9BACI|nr:hypothetical protein [Ectobacillus antri]MDG4657923.1 hypothetical protein [Ectobacillus antri]MDG5754993.1 hypothetical protein [Ectobacillus antri]